MTFGYECRPSLWRTLRSNSHLVIAAFGTASFLAVAAIALWLALPSVDRPAFAEASQEPLAQASASPSASAKSVAAKSVIVAKPPPVEANAVAAETGAVPSDLRWKDPNGAKSPTQTAAKAAQAVNAEAGSAEPAVATSPQLAAFAAANRAEVNGDADTSGAADVAQTAAVPTPRPAKPEKQVAKAETDEPQPASTGGGEAAPGHILRGVTMRSGPKKGAAAIGTIPAKTAVQIVDCKRWCEILYNGKRGWVYKTFVARD
ncbi:SH3 domain-containing protein [Mesorhizobium sp. A556]